MSRPSRPSDPNNATSTDLLCDNSHSGEEESTPSERIAGLLIDVLRSCVRESKFVIHDFVIMPNHLHVLLTVPGDLSIEKAMQLIKGCFSFRARREVEFKGEIWQRGFSDVRITDEASFDQHRAYIEQSHDRRRKDEKEDLLIQRQPRMSWVHFPFPAESFIEMVGDSISPTRRD